MTAAAVPAAAVIAVARGQSPGGRCHAVDHRAVGPVVEPEADRLEVVEDHGRGGPDDRPPDVDTACVQPRAVEPRRGPAGREQAACPGAPALLAPYQRGVDRLPLDPR